MLLVGRPDLPTPVVGVGIDDVVGNVATKIFDDPSVTGSIPQVGGEEMPEIMRCHVVSGVSTRFIPAGGRGMLSNNAPNPAWGDAIPPTPAGRNKQRFGR